LTEKLTVRAALARLARDATDPEIATAASYAISFDEDKPDSMLISWLLIVILQELRSK